MTWSNKYKKTIDCSNPKGFSQKAHCRARKLRQMGQETESEPVSEDLRNWFREKWVNIAKKKKEGGYEPCGTSGKKKGYAKCVPAAKAASMSASEIKSAVRRKRAAQSAAGRPGKDQPGQGNKPIMVKTMKEEQLQEKNTPTNPKLWARAKSLAKSKFDVYPSAYANGWAAKWYRGKGGGWRSTNEEVASEETLQELSIKTKVKAKIAKWNKYGSMGSAEGQKAYHKDYRREKYAELQKTKNNVQEELGRENEWGRPELTRKMLAVTPGQENADIPGVKMHTFKEFYTMCDTLKDYDNNVKLAGAQTAIEVEDDLDEYQRKYKVSDYTAANDYEREETGGENEEYDGIEEAAPAWQRKEGKSESGGLNRKGIASYRRANPGSKLSMAVTTKPSKLKPGSKAAKRRKSFCARMGGMKKRLTSAKTARDPNSRINKALRKWNCN